MLHRLVGLALGAGMFVLIVSGIGALVAWGLAPSYLAVFDRTFLGAVALVLICGILDLILMRIS